jgi:hypothetical protein
MQSMMMILLMMVVDKRELSSCLDSSLEGEERSIVEYLST